MRQSRFYAVVIGSLLLWSSVEALAQTCPVPSSPEEARTLAGENFSAAQEAYEMGRPLRALNHYRCSYQLYPHQSTLYNLATLAQGIGESQIAVDAFREHLERFPEADERNEVLQRLQTIEAQLAALAPPPEPTPPPQPVPPPAQPVQGAGWGPAPEPQSPPVQPAQDAGWGQAPEPQAPVTEVPIQEDLGTTTAGRRLAWIALSLGGATAVMGGVLMGLASNLNAQFHDEIEDRQISIDELNVIGDQGWSYYVSSWVLMGTGAALLVTSIVLFAAVPGRTSSVNASSPRRRLSAVLSPYVTEDNGFGLTFNGMF